MCVWGGLPVSQPAADENLLGPDMFGQKVQRSKALFESCFFISFIQFSLFLPL